MGIKYLRGRRKFHAEQLELIQNKLQNFFDNSAAKMTRKQYLMMCEQLGNEPIESEIPADFTDFPYEVQEAINIFSILPDNWEGMLGTYMGKDYSILPYLFDEIFEVSDKKQSMQLILIIARIVTEQYSKQQKERQRKAKTASKTKKG